MMRLGLWCKTCMSKIEKELQRKNLPGKKVRFLCVESHIPITVRQLEAIIRISESLAKMQLANVVTT
jgi:DNA replicative helicase MCM subunit Mcm2 (Cdc46/Mcm family)